MANEVLHWILLIIGMFIVIKILQKIWYRLLCKKRIIYRRRRPYRPYLSAKVKAKANRKFYKLLNRFKETHHHKPTKEELFRIIINASHITIRRRGGRGHWGRQKIRKYLLEKHNIVENYKMR